MVAHQQENNVMHNPLASHVFAFMALEIINDRNLIRFRPVGRDCAILHGDGDVLDYGHHSVTHVLYDTDELELTFFCDTRIVYVCNEQDDELDVRTNFVVYSDIGEIK